MKNEVGICYTGYDFNMDFKDVIFYKTSNKSEHNLHLNFEQNTIYKSNSTSYPSRDRHGNNTSNTPNHNDCNKTPIDE